MADVIKEITLRGQELVVAEMTILEVEGDSTVMHFSDVRVDRTFSEDERKTLFQVPTY